MHILLTDVLTCPRCGPQFGLILLADRMQERRVLDGWLGCANCRDRYPIRDGVVVFAAQAAPSSAEPEAASAAVDPQAVLRFAALMGVTGGPGYVLLAGPATVHAVGIAALLEGVEVVAVADPRHDAAARAAGGGVNRLETGPPLPLASAKMAGVVLSGGAADTLLEEAARLLAPLGRLVLEPAPADAAGRLEAAGLSVLAHEGDTLVAANRHAIRRADSAPGR